MRSLLYFFTAFLIFTAGCRNIEDATPSGKNSFIKFYHGSYNYEGIEVEVLPDGYALLGNMSIRADSVVAFMMKTDKQGNTLGNIQYYPGTIAKSFEVIYTANKDQVLGYMIAGDSIKINPAASLVGDIDIYSAHLIKTDENGNLQKVVRYTDLSVSPDKVRVDFKGISLTVTPDQVIFLGTYKEDLATSEKPFIVSFDLNLKANWSQQYDLLDHNYINGKSLHYQNGSIIWASAILKPSGDFNDSYLAIPKVQEKSTFENFSQLGEASSQLFLAREIQPAKSTAFGYGVVGTRAQTSGQSSNLFFIRVDVQGNLIPNSERYFDKNLSVPGSAIAFTDSDSEDTGESLTSTTDGGFALAGATQQGSNLRDVYLIKTNGLGDIIWSTTFGGTGDEYANSIKEDTNESLVIMGTNNLAGLSSVFLIKTDKNGKLEN